MKNGEIACVVGRVISVDLLDDGIVGILCQDTMDNCRDQAIALMTGNFPKTSPQALSQLIDSSATPMADPSLPQRLGSGKKLL